MSRAPVRVLVVRGRQANPWELRAWEELPPRYEAALLLTASNSYDVSSLRLPAVRVRALRDFLPAGNWFDLATRGVGERYLRLREQLAGFEIVHAAELSYWFSAEVARAKQELGFKLVQTVWETIPFLDAYRNGRARVFRRQVVAATDLYLAATERAGNALRLEGVPDSKIKVSYPGVDVERFRGASVPVTAPTRHTIVSPGRLEWEKGHQDVLRAIAAIARGLVTTSDGRPVPAPVLRVVGSGPEAQRLERYAAELELGGLVEFGAVPYDEMPALYASASCVVLASLPSAGCMLHPADIPHCFWEEQFGMVLAEALAADLPIVASTCGAIPEVVGETAEYFAPGDWMGLARKLVDGPLARSPGVRANHPAALVERYSNAAAARRLAAAYDGLFS